MILLRLFLNQQAIIWIWQLHLCKHTQLRLLLLLLHVVDTVRDQGADLTQWLLRVRLLITLNYFIYVLIPLLNMVFAHILWGLVRILYHSLRLLWLLLLMLHLADTLCCRLVSWTDGSLTDPWGRFRSLLLFFLDVCSQSFNNLLFFLRLWRRKFESLIDLWILEILLLTQDFGLNTVAIGLVLVGLDVLVVAEVIRGLALVNSLMIFLFFVVLVAVVLRFISFSLLAVSCCPDPVSHLFSLLNLLLLFNSDNFLLKHFLF